MNYGDLKSHFNDLLNRTDITTTLTTRFIDQGLLDPTELARSSNGEAAELYNLRQYAFGGLT